MNDYARIHEVSQIDSGDDCSTIKITLKGHMDTLHIRTKIDKKDQIILQSVTMTTGGGITETISNTILRTQEAQIKEGLIKLGWTPPAEPLKAGGNGIIDTPKVSEGGIMDCPNVT